MKTLHIKIVLFLVLLFECFSVGAQNLTTLQKSNESAKDSFLFKLKYIDNYIHKNSESSYLIPYYIGELEDLTNIISESDGTIIGKVFPTEVDVRKWNQWFIRNKEHLFWDDSIKKIVFRKDTIKALQSNMSLGYKSKKHKKQ